MIPVLAPLADMQRKVELSVSGFADVRHCGEVTSREFDSMISTLRFCGSGREERTGILGFDDPNDCISMSSSGIPCATRYARTVRALFIATEAFSNPSE